MLGWAGSDSQGLWDLWKAFFFRQPGFKSRLHPVLAVWSLASHSTSLSLWYKVCL